MLAGLRGKDGCGVGGRGAMCVDSVATAPWIVLVCHEKACRVVGPEVEMLVDAGWECVYYNIKGEEESKVDGGPAWLRRLGFAGTSGEGDASGGDAVTMGCQTGLVGWRMAKYVNRSWVINSRPDLPKRQANGWRLGFGLCP